MIDLNDNNPYIITTVNCYSTRGTVHDARCTDDDIKDLSHVVIPMYYVINIAVTCTSDDLCQGEYEAARERDGIQYEDMEYETLSRDTSSRDTSGT